MVGRFTEVLLYIKLLVLVHVGRPNQTIESSCIYTESRQYKYPIDSTTHITSLSFFSPFLCVMGVFMLPIMVKSNDLFSPLEGNSLVVLLVLSLSVVV